MNLERTCLLLSLCIGCADEGVVGQESVPTLNYGSTSGEVSCIQMREYDSIPSGNQGNDPAILAEHARGVFVSSDADRLDVDIADYAAFTENFCQPDVPVITLQLKAYVRLQTKDGAWNERLPLRLAQAPNAGLNQFEGTVDLPLADVMGSFVLPKAAQPADDKMRLTFLFKDDTWTVTWALGDGSSDLLRPLKWTRSARFAPLTNL